MIARSQILGIVEKKGPVSPRDISRDTGENLLMVSAMLSELVSSKKIKLTYMKIGSSPLYYIDGQETKFQDFADKLSSERRGIFSKIKKEKLLKDSSLSPQDRVSVREIKDFAFPVIITLKDKKELFWKWYLASTEEVHDIIKQRFVPQMSPVEKPVVSVDISVPASENVAKKSEVAEKVVVQNNFSEVSNPSVSSSSHHSSQKDSLSEPVSSNSSEHTSSQKFSAESPNTSRSDSQQFFQQNPPIKEQNSVMPFPSSKDIPQESVKSHQSVLAENETIKEAKFLLEEERKKLEEERRKFLVEKKELEKQKQEIYKSVTPVSPKEDSPKDDVLFKEVVSVLSEFNIFSENVKNIVIEKKGKEVSFFVEIDSVFGKIPFMIKASSKKRVSSSDLDSLSALAVEKKVMVLFLFKGSPSKKIVSELVNHPFIKLAGFENSGEKIKFAEKE